MTNETTARETAVKNDSPSESSNTAPQKQRTKLDYVELAKERNARVILHNTPDTYPLTELARYADQSIRRLRNRIMISIAPKQALPLLDEYNDTLIRLHKVIEKICTITNVRYRQPRALEQILGERSAESEDEIQRLAENPTDSEKK